MLAAGSTLADRFELQRRLGAGGMGEVYEALDRATGELVALKTLAYADGDTLLRFKREFRSLQSTSHPNLVSLRELIRAGDRWFFTMELVRGRHLLEHVGRDPERLRAVLPQLVRGLRVLHDAGMIHRDVKPPNVMVTDEGRVIVLDFGLITTIDPARQSTEGRAIGTIEYMAPEQAVGRKVSAAADWYAVGVMMFEALTGRVPYEGHALQILVNKQQVEAPAPRTLAPDAPEDLAALCQELLRIDPDARPTGAEIARRLGGDEPADDAGAQRPRRSSGRSVFVGRDREVAALRASFARARDRPLVHLVIGESGIGKSELVARFVRLVEDEDPQLLALHGRCYERESVPYKALDAVVDGVAAFLDRLEPAALAAVLPARPATLVRMFPVFVRVAAIASARAATDAGDPQEQRRRVFASLRDLFGAICAFRRVLITIDDLQWADTDSFLLLRELLRGADAPPILVIATVRTSGDATAIAQLEERLAGLPLTQTELGPLSDDESRQLAERLVPGAAARIDVPRVAREAAGHPMFLQEMLRHLGTGAATATLDDALWARVALLAADERALLELICLAGAPIAFDVASAASRLDGTQLTRAVSALRGAGLARETQRGRGLALEPYHDRVREAVSGRLAHDRQLQLHAQLALALERSVGPRDPQLLLHHFRLAELPERAAGYAEEAAERSLHAHAFDQAAARWRDALELVPRAPADRRRVQIRLGEALIAAGRGAEAAEIYLAASDGADRATRLMCHRFVAEQLLISGRIERGVASLREVLREVGVDAPASPRAVLFSLLRSRTRLRLRGLGFKPRDRHEISDADVLRLDVLGVAATGLSIVDTIRGADFQTRQLLLALASGHRPHIVRALVMEASYVATRGDHVRAESLFKRAKEIAGEVADPYLQGLIAGTQGIATYLTGDAPRALQMLGAGEKVLRQVPGANWELDSLKLFTLFVMRIVGDFAAVRRRYDRYAVEAEQCGDLYLASTMRRACVPMWLAEDDPAGAEADLARATWVPAGEGYHVQHFHELVGWGELALYSDRPDDPRLAPGFARLDKSLMVRVAAIRSQASYLRGRLAAHVGDRRSVERHARELDRIGTAIAAVWAQLLRAAAAHLRADRDALIKTLVAADQAARAAGMLLSAASARWQLAILRADPAAQAEARAAMTALGVRAPAKLAAMLIPLAPRS
jgi:tetratricopeptide (TPR) repeat protein